MALEELAFVWSKKPKIYNDDKDRKRNRAVFIPSRSNDRVTLLLWYGTSHYLHEILGHDTSMRGLFYETDVKDKLVRLIVGTSHSDNSQFDLSIDDDTGIFYGYRRTEIDVADVEALKKIVAEMIAKISTP